LIVCQQIEFAKHFYTHKNILGVKLTNTGSYLTTKKGYTINKNSRVCFIGALVTI